MSAAKQLYRKDKYFRQEQAQHYGTLVCLTSGSEGAGRLPATVAELLYGCLGKPMDVVAIG